MSKVFFESNGMTSLLSVDQEEDLQLRPGEILIPLQEMVDVLAAKGT